MRVIKREKATAWESVEAPDVEMVAVPT
jgi:hypothetical protein